MTRRVYTKQRKFKFTSTRVCTQNGRSARSDSCLNEIDPGFRLSASKTTTSSTSATTKKPTQSRNATIRQKMARKRFDNATKLQIVAQFTTLHAQGESLRSIAASFGVQAMQLKKMATADRVSESVSGQEQVAARRKGVVSLSSEGAPSRVCGRTTRHQSASVVCVRYGRCFEP